eukprot:TRINITY_DN2286_c0_g1_i2.p1 TRINITY_DN2286_c0_g1~~TRINITY_DN2286_c0_g1_i2.p1  ORF type:complete len:119 (-),score=43.39 TRINITY_DN2286_c0_g1_i2:128-484(-)
MAAEAEFNRLNRRVQELEEDLETTGTKFVLASQKLDKAATTADDSDRMKKVLENRAADDEKKLIRLAEELKEAQKMAEDADKKSMKHRRRWEIVNVLWKLVMNVLPLVNSKLLSLKRN